MEFCAKCLKDFTAPKMDKAMMTTFLLLSNFFLGEFFFQNLASFNTNGSRSYRYRKKISQQILRHLLQIRVSFHDNMYLKYCCFLAFCIMNGKNSDLISLS